MMQLQSGATVLLAVVLRAETDLGRRLLTFRFEFMTPPCEVLCVRATLATESEQLRDHQDMLEQHQPGGVRDEALRFFLAEFTASTSGPSLWEIGESSERESKPFNRVGTFL
ncbi:hypothetical protein VNO77_03611 [Canavalia gladiata]|uniref:Uncharacterized protein n=1 Tax=Canavalia gladiata TaxID=3824 RepID=A0AAN9MVM7_CANGL